ncbi:MAG TPA: hypothetical protein VFW86_04830 [Candidatus Limnocylindrales bacterium]|jgi:hypothetical protein|nr:hypothetical protein [Candidatus Limnocylindrales bacterium]
MSSSGPRAEAARAEVRAIAAERGHAVDINRRAADRLVAAFEAGDLQRTPFLDRALIDLDAALDQEAGQKLGGKSAEASRFILRAILGELDQA